MSWFDEAIFYHIYSLGYCGCERERSEVSEVKHRILKVIDNIPHIKSMGFNAIYFGPVFESVLHGYDTIDYTKIDPRLGTNEDFAQVCDELHKNGIKVIIDGVFNHVGRDFKPFMDVREHKLSSWKKDWFHIREGNSPYNDGFWYDGWEGHYELVRLNLYNPEVKNYLKECVSGWIKEFGIDGLRLDVAYCLEQNFLKELHTHCKTISNDFFLLGETLHGDYNKWMNESMLDSVTNYECYKGLFSSFNELNMFEIAHSINRQFGSENWCLYRGKHLYNFIDNHDVSRIATMLKHKEHLTQIYTLMFTMPGIPAVYYGSEFGLEGDKKNGDGSLRTEFNPEKMKTDGICDLTEFFSKLISTYKQSNALVYGDYKQLQLTNRQYAFSRNYGEESVITLINADNNDFTFNLKINRSFTDLLSGKKFTSLNGLVLKGYSSAILRAE